MKLYVQLDSGEMHEFVARSSDSMTVVKSQIKESLGIPPSRQKLWFGGNELQDAPTLAHALWEALKKVQGATDASGSRIDLNKVKQLCSPSSSPLRGLSPAHSHHNLEDLAHASTNKETTRTLENAALQLAGGRRSSSTSLADNVSPMARQVSPERRMAALTLESQYQRTTAHDPAGMTVQGEEALDSLEVNFREVLNVPVELENTSRAQSGERTLVAWALMRPLAPRRLCAPDLRYTPKSNTRNRKLW
eukprot:CAMPEP_0181301850 /NCGR_PEP_ID=MMETSP1101-20121128/7653_1 /TAXON_ID=46948 /ORGANISM="Rhodomonas abbreviata, Strain Caron Lab Isolate" /LENGTH=248 /DNA_ID=CAMNT_0023407201 /DNA_START=176 /DNA_END=920 /DNA_ORIENTATION=-